MKKSFKTILIAVLFIGLIGIITGIYLFTKKHPDLNKVKPDFTMTATELQREFEGNETAAAERYVNKIIDVTGVIGNVKKGENDILSISLKTGSEFSSVICTFSFQSDPDKLLPGNEVTIRGECSGFLMDVLLNNCVLIE